MKEFSQLAQDLAKDARMLKYTIYYRVRIMSLLILSNVIKLSPVDTGRLRASWILTLGTPSEKIAEGYDTRSKNDLDMMRHARWAENEAYSRGINALNPSKFDGTQPVWIVNNVPYLKYLNEGTSRRPPMKFVEQAIQDSKDAIGKAKTAFNEVLDRLNGRI